MKTLLLAVFALLFAIFNLLLACTTGTEVGEPRALGSTPVAGSQGEATKAGEVSEAADTDVDISGWLDSFAGLDWYTQVMLLAAAVGLVIVFRKPLGALLTKVAKPLKKKGAAKKG